MTVSEKRKPLVKLIVSTVAIVALLGVFYLVMRALGVTDLSREQIQNFIASTGAVAPLCYIAISFLQVTFVPIPGAVTILAGSYLFGAGWAFFYSYIGMLLGAMAAFGLGKWIGRPFVNWITGGQEKTDEWLRKLKGREKVLLFFMFLFPLFPDDALCAVAGVLPISWMSFFAMQLVTRATSVGATLLLMSGEFIPFEGWGLAVLGVIAAVGIVAFIFCFKEAERINAFFAQLTERLFPRKKAPERDEKNQQTDGNNPLE